MPYTSVSSQSAATLPMPLHGGADALNATILQMLAHDMRGTLADVRLSLVESLLMLRGSATPEAVALLEQAEHDVSQLFDTVVSMLHLARSEPSERSVDAVDLGFDLPSTVQQQLRRAHAKHLDLDLSTCDPLPWILGDTTIVTIVLDNLLSNAIKYSPIGGTVRIHVRASNDEVTLSVIDEGCGIPEAERHLLFRQPGRRSPRPTDGESSFGLGLYLAAQLAGQIGGRLGYAPAEGQGSVFMLHLPAFHSHPTEQAASV